MTIKRKGWSLCFAVGALIYAIDSFYRFSEGEAAMGGLKGTISAILAFHAIYGYRETWLIEEENRIFTIQRNGKVRFQGRRLDLTIVTTDYGNYFLTPAKGRTIRIPKKAANEALLRLVGKTESSDS